MLKLKYLSHLTRLPLIALVLLTVMFGPQRLSAQDDMPNSEETVMPMPSGGNSTVPLIDESDANAVSDSDYDE